MRYNLLGEEYAYLDKMDSLETRLNRTIHNMKNYNLMEFYHEKKELNDQLKDFRHDLDSFNLYLPKTVTTLTDHEVLRDEVTNELNEKMKGLVKVSLFPI